MYYTTGKVVFSDGNFTQNMFCLKLYYNLEKFEMDFRRKRFETDFAHIWDGFRTDFRRVSSKICLKSVKNGLGQNLGRISWIWNESFWTWDILYEIYHNLYIRPNSIRKTIEIYLKFVWNFVRNLPYYSSVVNQTIF